MTEFALSVLLILLAVLILISGFFSASETGMMSLNRYKLKHRAKTDISARRLYALIERPDRLLAIILIGNNFVNIFASSLATLIAIRLLGNSALALSVATAIMTLSLLIFAETTPKVLAALHPERVAKIAYWPLQILLWILYPLVWFLNMLSNRILRTVGVSTQQSNRDTLTPEELKTILRDTTANLSGYHKNMLLGILDLTSVSVNDIMIAKNDIWGLDINSDLSQIQQTLLTSKFTILPVFRENLDGLLGTIHLKDVTEMMQTQDFTQEHLLAKLHKAYYIPEEISLYDQLIHFQKEQQHTAFVVDEYGEILGLITFNDILEEIIGHLSQHTDILSQKIELQPDGSYIIDCSLNIRYLNKFLNWDLPTDGPKTLNGLIIEHYEAMPIEHVCLLLAHHPVEILKVDGTTIKKARLAPSLLI